MERPLHLVRAAAQESPGELVRRRPLRLLGLEQVLKHRVHQLLGHVVAVLDARLQDHEHVLLDAHGVVDMSGVEEPLDKLARQLVILELGEQQARAHHGNALEDVRVSVEGRVRDVLDAFEL